MLPHASQTVVSPLRAGDLVAMAQCMAIDAESFPFASIHFDGDRRSGPLWIARETDAHGQVASQAASQVTSQVASRVVGFIATRRHRRDLDIEGLAVTRDAQRRGVGRALLRTAMGYARRGPFATVSLHVWEGNAPAIRMYEREGFGILRAQRGYYRPGAFDAAGNAYEMVLPLAT